MFIIYDYTFFIKCEEVLMSENIILDCKRKKTIIGILVHCKVTKIFLGCV